MKKTERTMTGLRKHRLGIVVASVTAGATATAAVLTLFVLSVVTGCGRATAERDVCEITIKKRPGYRVPPLSELEIGGPDYYLVISLADGTKVKTDYFKDKPIGNGLTWKLQEQMKLRNIRTIEVWDKDLWYDNCLDQIEVRCRSELEGSHYCVTIR